MHSSPVCHMWSVRMGFTAMIDLPIKSKSNLYLSMHPPPKKKKKKNATNEHLCTPSLEEAFNYLILVYPCETHVKPTLPWKGFWGTDYRPIPNSHPCTHPSPVSAQQACTYARRGLTWVWGYCLSPHPYIAPLYSPLPCKRTTGLYMPDVVLHGSGGTVYHPIPKSHPCMHPCTHPTPVSAQQACICQTWSQRGLGYCLSPHP